MARRKIIKGKGPIRVKYIPPDLPKKIPNSIMGPVMRRLAGRAILVIQTDTEMGFDADMKPFRPYNAVYARMRAHVGRSTDVDMSLTGDMLRSMTVRKTNKRSFELGFEDGDNSHMAPLVTRAWGKMSKEDRSAVWAWAAMARRNAGKGPGVGRRKSKAVKGRAATQGPQWGGPPATNSEKARWTNQLRPWFTLGRPSGPRVQLLAEEAVDMLAAALKL